MTSEYAYTEHQGLCFLSSYFYGSAQPSDQYETCVKTQPAPAGDQTLNLPIQIHHYYTAKYFGWQRLWYWDAF